MSVKSVSIITVSYNSLRTIKNTISSVLAQTYHHIEYIVVDGASTDGTIDIIRSFGDRISQFISEPDNGIYDALNKGIRLAKGDIVGILNSDDFFYDNSVIENIAESFSDESIEAIFGDAQFVDPLDTTRIVRYYRSKSFTKNKFRFGYMPAHTGFYAKKDLFDKFGYYKTDYKIAADFELLLRFLLINNIKYKYFPIPFVCMRTGGVSNKSFNSNITLNNEIARACRENGIYTNFIYIYSKYFFKIFQFIGVRSKSRKNGYAKSHSR
jgi:glycosyltransferase involved in cell wall biosynthesis